MSFPPSLLAVCPCAEYRKPPVRTNRGSLFFPTAGRFRPRLGSMEFGFWGLRRVGREGADRPISAFSRAALYFCPSNKVFIGDDAPSSAVKLHFLSGVRTGPRRRRFFCPFYHPVLLRCLCVFSSLAVYKAASTLFAAPVGQGREALNGMKKPPIRRFNQQYGYKKTTGAIGNGGQSTTSGISFPVLRHSRINATNSS